MGLQLFLVQPSGTPILNCLVKSLCGSAPLFSHVQKAGFLMTQLIFIVVTVLIFSFKSVL